MRLRFFKADKGDCLLLSGHDGRNILIDGGMRGAFRAHVLPYLSRLRRRGRIDVMYCSHIDRDHIQGLMDYLDGLVRWRVHRHQRDTGNTSHPVPSTPQPPAVGRIWHNGFAEQTGQNLGDIANMLSNQAVTLSAHPDDLVRKLALASEELAQSVGDAIHFSRRFGGGQLGIPLNPDFDGRLMLHNDGPPLRVGGMRVTVIGPFQEDLVALRDEWNDWLRRNQAELGRIRRRTADGEGLDQGNLQGLLNRLHALAETAATSTDVVVAREAELAQRRNKVLGRRQRVTTPNLASLMLLVTERGRSVLLTGDGHHQDIIDGLDLAGQLDDAGRIHVDVLKFPHHGSEHNANLAFCQNVTANHYVFCGNGAHENPDLDIVDALIDARIGPVGRRATNRAANRSFKLWFNYASDDTDLSRTQRHHMRALERLVTRRARNQRRLRFEFMTASHKAISLRGR